MCGIAGFVGKRQEGLLEAMTRALIHRGPDEEGSCGGENWGLGVRRLKVIDLNTGSQPIHNEDQNLWIVFNGEIYNFEELREGLIKRGHRFYTRVDTEVIIHLYEEEGPACLKKLRGMFSLAVWDKREEKLFLARDRLGKKPLYYYRDGELFIFASELKALLKYRKFSRELDPLALDAYLSFLYVPRNLSIFKGIKKLPPASFLILEGGRMDIKRYWHLSRGPAIKAPLDDIKKMVEGKLEEAVKIRLRSDVPLGVFLSGGIDSSAVVAMMSRFGGGEKIKTFSIGYGDEAPSYNELRFSRLVARHFGTEHQECILTPQLKELVYEVVSHLDEPFADSSAIPNYLISRLAREKVTVALSGTGGDELFAGYPRYLGMRLSYYYEQFPLGLRKYLEKVLYPLIPESTESRNLGGWIKRFIRGGSLSPYLRYMSWISFFNAEEKEALYTREMKESLKAADPFSFHRQCFAEAGPADFLDKVFYLDQSTYLTDDLLHLGDEMSMANSLELRLPFCDQELVELAGRLPAGLKLKNFKLKYVLKEMLDGILPAEVLFKRKQGFMVPLGIWFKKDLNSLVRELLNEGEIRSMRYFNPAYVHWMMDEHFRGHRNFTDKLWSLLVFQVWHKIFMERSATIG